MKENYLKQNKTTKLGIIIDFFFQNLRQISFFGALRVILLISKIFYHGNILYLEISIQNKVKIMLLLGTFPNRCETLTFQETSTATSVRVVGRKRSVQTVQNCEKLQAAVVAAPRMSLCRYASSLCFLLCIAYRMLKHDLDCHPTNCKLFKSWKKPILPGGKNFANNFCTCN